MLTEFWVATKGRLSENILTMAVDNHKNDVRPSNINEGMVPSLKFMGRVIMSTSV